MTGMKQIMNESLYAQLAASLAGLVSLGFLAWAGVVWRTAARLREMLAELRQDQAVLIEKVNRLTQEVDMLRAELKHLREVKDRGI